MKKYSKISTYFLPVISCLLLFMVLEGVFWLNSKLEFVGKLDKNKIKFETYIPVPQSIQKEFDVIWPIANDKKNELPEFGELDRSLQYQGNIRVDDGGNIRGFKRFAPNSGFKSKVVVRNTGQPIYDVRISVDEYSRRKVFSIRDNATEHLIFIGGSFTWGEGVGDQDIFTEHIQKKLTNYQAYIAAMPGYGPNDNLELLLNDGWLFKGIKQKSGYAVFFLIEDHFNRLLPTMRLAAKQPYRLVKSHFKLINGELIWDGHFSQKLKYRLATIVGKSHFFNFFGVDLLFNTQKKRSDLGLGILLEMEKQLKVKHGTKELILVILNRGEAGSALKSQWQKYGKMVFDYSRYDFKKSTRMRHNFVLDTHPTGRVHWLYAKLLERDLKKVGITF